MSPIAAVVGLVSRRFAREAPRLDRAAADHSLISDRSHGSAAGWRPENPPLPADEEGRSGPGVDARVAGHSLSGTPRRSARARVVASARDAKRRPDMAMIAVIAVSLLAADLLARTSSSGTSAGLVIASELTPSLRTTSTGIVAHAPRMPQYVAGRVEDWADSVSVPHWAVANANDRVFVVGSSANGSARDDEPLTGVPTATAMAPSPQLLPADPLVRTSRRDDVGHGDEREPASGRVGAERPTPFLLWRARSGAIVLRSLVDRDGMSSEQHAIGVIGSRWALSDACAAIVTVQATDGGRQSGSAFTAVVGDAGLNAMRGRQGAIVVPANQCDHDHDADASRGRAADAASMRAVVAQVNDNGLVEQLGLDTRARHEVRGSFAMRVADTQYIAAVVQLTPATTQLFPRPRAPSVAVVARSTPAGDWRLVWSRADDAPGSSQAFVGLYDSARTERLSAYLAMQCARGAPVVLRISPDSAGRWNASAPWTP